MMRSIFTGATGMKAQSDGMSIISNNIANINTVGFKKSMPHFQELISQSMPARSNTITNMSQVGLGTALTDARRIFSQGGFETGSAVTDISIQGIGFFGVQRGDTTHYTRAGNFRFNYEGELLDPTGWNVLGYEIKDGIQSTTPSPISLDFSKSGVGYMAPKASSDITSILQLGKIGDLSDNPTNPFFNLVSQYDGTASPPLNKGSYSYSHPLQFYDSKGVLQSATIYIDGAGDNSGQSAMEFVIAVDPAKDTSNKAGTEAAGILMAGNFIFSSTGDITNITAYTSNSTNPADLASWQAASFKNGHPVLTGNVQGEAINLELKFGLSVSGNAQPASAAVAVALSKDEAFQSDTAAIRGLSSTTKQSVSNSSSYNATNGYPSGEIINLNISAEGVMTAMYSNNQSEDLYNFTIYRFTSEAGLRHEGKNHFSATPDAGNVTAGIPGEENFGTLLPWKLETSNVDYAFEFAELIVTQRAFQMNSKIITTSDVLLQKALELKRQ